MASDLDDALAPLATEELAPEPGERRPTRLLDVAARAGVPIKIVSNVVTGSTHAREEAAILELEYTPNPVAQALRNGDFGAARRS